MRWILLAAATVGLLAISTPGYAKVKSAASGYCPAGTCPQNCNKKNYADDVKNCSAANCKRCKSESKH